MFAKLIQKEKTEKEHEPLINCAPPNNTFYYHNYICFATHCHANNFVPHVCLCETTVHNLAHLASPALWDQWESFDKHAKKWSGE